MNRWTTLALVALCAGAHAQTTLFFDDFETLAPGAEPSTTIWNSGNSNPASTDVLSAYDASSGFPLLQGNIGMRAPIGPTGRKRYWGNLSRAVDANNEVAVLSFALYDDYTAANSGNARQFIQLVDYSVDFSRVSPSGVLQLVAMGNWNAANALNVGPLNGGYVGSVAGLGTYYHGRLLSAASGYWLPGAANGTVSWFVSGYTANKRRSTGWHEHRIAYSPNWAKFYSDGVEGFFYQHGKPAGFDQITIPPNESSPINAYYDTVLVRTFPLNSFNAKVDLLDYSGDQTQVPIDVEFVGLQNNNGLFKDNYGTVTVASVTQGTYDIRVKATHWLAKLHTGVVIDEVGSHNLTFSLINGDVDGDNEVGPGDFGMLSSSFGSVPGDGNWEPNADLDGDGEVGPSDFGVLSANFGMAGD